MTRLRVSARVALAASLLALVGLAAAGSAAGYLIEAHRQQAGRDHRLATAAAFVRHGEAKAETKQWQKTLTGKLAALHLSAQLTIASPTSKRSVYQPHSIASDSKQRTSTPGPTATYVFPLAKGSSQRLRLDLFAPPLDRNRRLLVALASGLAALVAGAILVLWAASRALIAPLHRLNTRVEAIAGGDPIEMARTTSPIREVDNVAAAFAGMTARLEQAAEQDARTEAERRLLVSSIAHDLRTPLFSLRGYLDAIDAGIGNPQERLDRVREKADEIDRLVTSLFDYATADLDQHPRLRETNLAEAITDTTRAFELAAQEHKVELRITGCADSPVMIDRDAFARALGNVLDNALHYSPPGSAVEIVHGEDANGVFVKVIDDGPGIPPDLLPHIFEPLVRADDARNGRPTGTGLGLSIASRLLQNQGATIDAANTPGRGATFTLRLRTDSTHVRDGVGTHFYTDTAGG